ncbi:MAG: hypothetical protein ACI4F1_03060 [Bariatricus sp.]
MEAKKMQDIEKMDNTRSCEHRKGRPPKKDYDAETLIQELKECSSEENLWNCIVAFQDYPFYTSSGLPFRYTLKIGRNGEYTKELFIDRRENSKSLSWSSVRIAFGKAIGKKGYVFKRPKEIADVRGISYVYSLLWRFGVIMVPEEVEMKLRGE